MNNKTLVHEKDNSSKNQHSTEVIPVKPKKVFKSTNHSLSCDNIKIMEVLIEEEPDPDPGTKTNSNTPADNNASGAWEALEEEISDINLLIQKSSEKEASQVMEIDEFIYYNKNCFIAGNT